MPLFAICKYKSLLIYPTIPAFLGYHKTMQDQKDTQALYDAIALLEGKEEIERFLADLCTPGEIKAFSERWAIARLLDEGRLSYRDISQKTGASTTTVARVARFLRQEPHQGYGLVLERLGKRK